VREPLRDVSLAPYTSYRIGGIAREAYFPESAEELRDILFRLRENRTKWFVLGGGSNVLVGDCVWEGAVILTTRMDAWSAQPDRIVCGAGIPSSRVAEIARDHAKTGLEFLYLLPGSIGGALAGNARYDSLNASDPLTSLVAVHPEHGIRTFLKKDISFSYKHDSIVALGYIICSLELAWSEGDPEAISRRMEEIRRVREASGHFSAPSCGCIFKNDHARNIQAGRLIDSLGLKGLSQGGAKIADFHANFVINTGNATASDVLTLIERIERIVRERTGITLEREVRLAGTFCPPE
jgi:UDP-N-acetylmuramate dehydrogenase